MKTKASTERFCEIWLSKTNKWYVDLAVREYGEREDSFTYGPFSSEKAAENYILRGPHSNPGSFYTDKSGKRKDSKTSPNGRPVIQVGMKNEIKELYKKDKQLALEVAKVLGYKIKSDIRSKNIQAKVLYPIEDCVMVIRKAMHNFDSLVGKNYNKEFDKLAVELVGSLNEFRSLLKKEYRL